MWSSLPQTSQAGEFVGLAAARQLACGATKRLVSDCTSVVKAACQKLQWQRKCKFYSGVLRDSELEPGAHKITSASHVKSHQADGGHIPAGFSPQEENDIIGNMAADELATEAKDMHEPFDDIKFKAAKKAYHMARNVLLLAARALPEWQASKHQGKKHYREEVLQARSIAKHSRDIAQVIESSKPQKLTAYGGHFWIPHGGKGHICALCSSVASNLHQKNKKSKDLCVRDLGQLGVVLDNADSTNHNLFWSIHQQLGVRVLSCNKCDSYATVAPKNLLEPCIPKEKRPSWERFKKRAGFRQASSGTLCACVFQFTLAPFLILVVAGLHLQALQIRNQRRHTLRKHNNLHDHQKKY